MSHVDAQRKEATVTVVLIKTELDSSNSLLLKRSVIDVGGDSGGF